MLQFVSSRSLFKNHSVVLSEAKCAVADGGSGSGQRFVAIGFPLFLVAFLPFDLAGDFCFGLHWGNELGVLAKRVAMSSPRQLEIYLVVEDFGSCLGERFLALGQFFNFVVFAVDSLVSREENVAVAHGSVYFSRHLALGDLLLLMFKQFLPLIGISNML